jgi:AcrR family transcriptional regulator
MLAERLCESMLHVGIGVSHQSPDAARVPALRCMILLHGVAVEPPSNRALDRSDARRAAESVVAAWDADDPDEDQRIRTLKVAARTEFGRRGYEATTVRDLAAAAGFSTGSVYRLVDSKDQLLRWIMQAFTEKIADGWRSVIDSDSTPVEKLDALLWINIQALLRFNEELNIQMAWFRQAPPSSPDLGGVFTATLRDVRALLTQGTRAGELQLTGGSVDTRARCLYETMWTPGRVLAHGTEAAFALARDTVLRGALVRSK